MPKPKKGDRELLVRVLNMNDPARPHDYQSPPVGPAGNVRAKKDPRSKRLRARSFGLDKRLVIASRSVAPDFEILLFPLRAGDPLPKTTWDAAKTRLTLTAGGRSDVFDFVKADDGRTRVTATRDGKDSVSIK